MNRENDISDGNHELFKLSDEHLLNTFHDAAEALVLAGYYQPNIDAQPYLQESDRQPYLFTYTIPPAVAADVFHESFMITDAHMSYGEPHRLDEFPDDQPTSFLRVEINGQLPDTDIDVSYLYSIDDDQAVSDISASVDVDYSRDGESLSRCRTTPDTNYAADDPRRYAAALEALDETSREMTLDDTEQILQLANYVTAHPQRS